MKPYTFIETASEHDFIQTSVSILKEKIGSAMFDHGSCIIGLSGGSTPKPIYEALGKEDIGWLNVKGFLVDERYVPKDHENSNQRMIRETLPNLLLTAPDTSLSIEQCVETYVKDLWKLWSPYLPDIIVLGIGCDGHIASLFPPLTEEMMDDRLLVIHTQTDEFEISDRVTLTMNPILSAGSHIIFLHGGKKKKVWEEMLKSPYGEHRWPLKAVLGQKDVTVATWW